MPVLESPIVTVTPNPALDVSVAVDELAPDRKLRCEVLAREPGGGGVNVARAVTRLNGRSLAIVACGGATGRTLLSLLASERVPTASVEIRGETRENLHVTERSTGRQYRFCLPGPELATEEWAGVLDRVDSIRPRPLFVAASGSLPPGVPADFYGRLARWARQNSVRVAIDASGEALRSALEAGVYLAKPSEREFSELLGGRTLDERRIREEARALVSRGCCRIFVVSRGPLGAVWITADGEGSVPAPAVVAKSSVGAGDSLLAGILVRLGKGDDVDRAVRFGVAAGAAATLRHGTDLCTIDDTDRLIAGA